MNSDNNITIWFVRLGLVLLTIVAFFPALEAGFITWDDPAMVLDNPYFHDLSPPSLLRLFTQPYMTVYQPLTVLSLAFQYRLSGMDPFFFHLGNLLLHCANVLLAFELSRRLGLSIVWACATAVLFAVHPGRVESVAWITERKDVLCAFFWFLCLLAYSWYVEKPSAERYSLVFFSFLFGGIVGVAIIYGWVGSISQFIWLAGAGALTAVLVVRLGMRHGWKVELKCAEPNCGTPAA